MSFITPPVLAQLYTTWQKHSFWGLAIVLLVVAAGLRLYQLGIVPHGMAWDEAAIGYNGYAVISTRRDEWLVKLPITFKSFGDYKAGLGIYINGIFTYLLGMHLWVVRLPFALFSLAAIVGWMLLVYDLVLFHSTALANSYSQADLRALRWRWALAAGFFMTSSPWHFHYSRVGFESGMALSLMIWALVFAIKWVMSVQPGAALTQKWQWFYLGAASLFTVATVYSYHSSKVTVPILGIVCIVLFFNTIQKNWQKAVVGVMIIAVLSFPLAQDVLYGSGNERFNQASLLTSTPLAQIPTTVTLQFFQHFTLPFLLGGQTETYRHGDGRHGVLDPIVFMFAVIGLAAMVILSLKQYQRNHAQSFLKPLLFLAIGWIVAGILPAAIGVDAPHSNRALLALPGFLLLALCGGWWFLSLCWEWDGNKNTFGSHGEKNVVIKAIVGCVILLHLAFFLDYHRYYFTTYQLLNSEDFKDGYLEALEYVVPYEKGLNGVRKVDQVVFTSDYGQPYIYALFVRRTNPIWYQGGSLNTYLFTDKIDAGDLERSNTVIVASAQDDLPLDRADKVIYGSDGQVRFKIYVNQ